MSFDQLSSIEAGGRRGDSSGYSDDPAFTKLTQDANKKLFKVQGNMASLGRDIGHLGTRQDNARVRERVNETLEETRGLFKEVGEAVKKVSAWEDVTPTQRYAQQKLSRELQSALSDFQTLQRKALEKEKASVSAARAAAEEGGAASEGSAHELQSQSQVQGQQQQQGHQQLQQQEQIQEQALRLASQDEVDFQEQLIIEREEEIRNIEQGVGDLNVLFTQVATMVSEQGEQLDNIADNVENVRTDTRGADYELRSAARHQRNARSTACCLLLILSIILTIILLAVFLG